MSTRSGTMNPHFTFCGHFMGAVTVTNDGKWTFTPNETMPRLSILQGRQFISESELTMSIAACFSAEEQEAMVQETARRHQEAEQARQERLRRARERTWTGDRYDPNRSLKDIIKLLKADIAQAVKANTLPPLRYEVRPRKGRDIVVVTDAVCLPKAKAALGSLQRRYNYNYNEGVPDGDLGDRQAFWFLVTQPSPLTEREKREQYKAVRRGEITHDEFWTRVHAKIDEQNAAEAEILRQYGAEWGGEA